MNKTHVLIGLCTCVFACTSPHATTNDAGTITPSADAAPFTKGVSTLAGVAETGILDGDRNVARFANPVNVLIAHDGTLYVADFDNGRIRTIDSTGNVSTLVSQPGFARPFGLALSATGTLYVQTDNDPNAGHTLTSGTIWRVDVTTHIATAIVTGLGRPRGLAVLADGRIAMADEQDHVIQLLDPTSGTTAVIAGTLNAPGYVDAVGAAARFSQPYGIAVRPDGKLVVSDYGNQRLRLVDVATGTTTTLGGSGTQGFADGPLAVAKFSGPQGVVIDSAGDIFVTDTGNFRVRRIRGETVDTIAGNGTGGYLDADDRLGAEMYGLEGLSVSPDGTNVFVADGSRGDGSPYNRVRLVNMAP